jgi:Na+-driven multidrug efflux pump
MRQFKMLSPDSRKMDMTEGKVFDLIMKFAIPLFIGSVFQQVYNMADSIVVGQFIGKNALAAVGGCASSYNLILALISGFSTAASVIIAQACGTGTKIVLYICHCDYGDRGTDDCSRNSGSQTAS